MARGLKLAIKILGWLLLLAVLVLAAGVAANWDTIRRVFLGGYHTHETVPPTLPAKLPRPAMLVFSKTNAFRHTEAIPAANALLEKLARSRGWGWFATENSAVFSPQILARFDTVVFNNVSGDSFSDQQEAALRGFIEHGGGFVGIHAAGDGSIPWDWYQKAVIGAHFIGHPMGPQFQQARVRTESKDHPASRDLPDTWTRTDEWYSFEHSPRAPDVHVLVTLDEASYTNHSGFGRDLSMGKDHPVAWWRCTDNGRVFYTAMGHNASAYREPEMVSMITGALDWTMRREKPDCPEVR